MLTPHFDDLQTNDLVAPEQRAKAASQTTWMSVVVNLCLSTAQICIGVFSKSQGLVADGIHSLSDLVADFIVLIANHFGQKDADENHPFGHYRFENAASFMLGLILLMVGVGMSISAIDKIMHHQHIPQVHGIAIYVALTALVAKELLFRYMLRIAKQVKSSLLVANAWHARTDAASSFVVMIGILGNLMGYPILDPIAALLVGCIIIKMGVEFGWEALSDLMDRAADEQDVAAIRETFLSAEGVEGVHDLRTRKMGDMIMIDAHIEVNGNLSVREGHEIAVNVRNQIMQKHRVIDVITHIDPV